MDRADSLLLQDLLPHLLPHLGPLVDDSGVLCAALLGRDGAIRRANRAFAGLVGCDLSALPGRELGEFLTSFDRASVDGWLKAADDAPGERRLVNFLLQAGAVQTLRCSFLPAGAEVLFLAEPILEDDRSLKAELLELNSQLTVLSRENARRGRELAQNVQTLSKEVEQRRVAEARLALHEAELERTVDARTRELREANLLLRRTQFAMDRSKDGVLWMTRDGRIIYANEAAERLTDRRGPELLAAAIDALCPAQTPEAWSALWQEAQARGGLTFEGVFRTAGGADVPVEVSANPLRYGEEEYACWFVRDITARNRAQEELQRLLRVTQEDAATKGRLVEEVNHRVKNNLVSIMGLLLAEKRNAPSEGLPWVEAATDSLMVRVRGMISAHEMLSETEWAPLPLAELARRVVGAIVVSGGGAGRVELDVAPSDVRVSPRQVSTLALALGELAANTLKHALPARERVRVAVRTEADSERYAVEYRDDGPGYPEGVLGGERPSSGLRLVSSLVEGTLLGSLALSNDHGAVATMRFCKEALSTT